MRNPARPITVLLIDEDQRWLRAITAELEPHFHLVVADCDRAAVNAIGTLAIDVVVTEAQIGMRKASQVQDLIARLAPGLETRTIYTTCGGFDPALRAFFEKVSSPVLYKSEDVLRLRNAIYALAQPAVAAA